MLGDLRMGRGPSPGAEASASPGASASSAPSSRCRRWLLRSRDFCRRFSRRSASMAARVGVSLDFLASIFFLRRSFSDSLRWASAACVRSTRCWYSVSVLSTACWLSARRCAMPWSSVNFLGCFPGPGARLGVLRSRAAWGGGIGVGANERKLFFGATAVEGALAAAPHPRVSPRGPCGERTGATCRTTAPRLRPRPWCVWVWYCRTSPRRCVFTSRARPWACRRGSCSWARRRVRVPCSM